MATPVDPNATLLDIISSNSSTEIGVRWNFAEVQSVEDFRRTVPLTDYEVYKPYIERMMEHGERNLVARGDVVFYAPTSGTTSKSKFIPKFSHYASDCWKYVIPSIRMGKSLLFTNIYGIIGISLGTPIVPGSSDVLDSLLAANTHQAPTVAYRIPNFTDAVYVQMVFALKATSKNTTVIISFFISALLTAFHILAKEWKKMVTNIRTGEFNNLKLSSLDRKSLEESLGGPDATRADELQQIFESAAATNFIEIVPQLWPDINLVSTICSGDFKHYIPRLQHFLGNRIALFSPFYGASEGNFAMNKWPYEHQSAYALLSESVFYEFIPLSQVDKPKPDVLLSDEVKTGENYEIVVTTREGLYRYRLGDIVTVLQISPDGPIIDVLGRKKMALNINGCKLYDFQINRAMSTFIAHFKMECTDVDYLISADTSNVPPRCVIWLECGNCDLPCSTTAVIEDHLKSSNLEYMGSVQDAILSPLLIEHLKPGTISSIKSSLKKRSVVGDTQIKLPRVVWDMDVLYLLRNSTV